MMIMIMIMMLLNCPLLNETSACKLLSNINKIMACVSLCSFAKEYCITFGDIIVAYLSYFMRFCIVFYQVYFNNETRVNLKTKQS